MKTLKKIGLVLAALLSLSMVVGCATFGMDQVESGDDLAWAKEGTWKGSVTSITYKEDGKSVANKSTNNDFSISGAVSTTVLGTNITTYPLETAIKAAVADSQTTVYVNSAKTHVVFSSVTYSSSTGAKTAEEKYDLKKSK